MPIPKRNSDGTYTIESDQGNQTINISMPSAPSSKKQVSETVKFKYAMEKAREGSQTHVSSSGRTHGGGSGSQANTSTGTSSNWTGLANDNSQFVYDSNHKQSNTSTGTSSNSTNKDSNKSSGSKGGSTTKTGSKSTNKNKSSSGKKTTTKSTNSTKVSITWASNTQKNELLDLLELIKSDIRTNNFSNLKSIKYDDWETTDQTKYAEFKKEVSSLIERLTKLKTDKIEAIIRKLKAAKKALLRVKFDSGDFDDSLKKQIREEIKNLEDLEAAIDVFCKKLGKL